VAAFLRGTGLVNHGKSVLAAVSGGPDSTALLLLLREATLAGLLPLDVHAAHLHHGLRGVEADDDLEFVRALAREQDVPFRAGRADVGALCRNEGIGLEEGGRRARYAFLRETAREIGANVVVTGHTRDDQAETVLLRILRGTGVTGLAGVHPVRPLDGAGTVHALRPLLAVPRRDLIAYLERRGASFREDATNLDPAFARNRLRLNLLPALRRVDPRVDEILAGLARDAFGLRRALETHHRNCPHPGFQIRPEGVRVPPPPLRGGQIDLASVLRGGFAAAGGDPRRLTRAHLRQLEGLWRGGRREEVTLPGNLPARGGKEGLMLGAPPSPVVESVDPAPLPVPGEARFGPWWLVASEADPPGMEALRREGGEGPEYVDAGALTLPLTVRSRRPGDRFHPLGAGGRTRLKEFLRARGVSREGRAGLPLVVDGSGRVVWVVGHRIAHWARLREGTGRAVRLEAVRIDEGGNG
jgi:tRNA(Ile)-lysidine synthase